MNFSFQDDYKLDQWIDLYHEYKKTKCRCTDDEDCGCIKTLNDFINEKTQEWEESNLAL